MTMERYELLKPYLDKYHRKFTVLDLGAGINPLIAQRIALDYDAVVVMVEQDQACMDYAGSNLVWLRKHFNLKELKLLANSEYFDVVIAFNFLHHFPKEEYGDAAAQVMSMGADVFIQIPSRQEPEGVPGFGEVIDGLNYMCNMYGGKLVAETVQFPQHLPRPLFHFDNHDCEFLLTRTHIEAHQDSAATIIHPSYTDSIAHLKGKGDKVWVPGINLWNFCKLGGCRPTRESILKSIFNFNLPTQHHGDVAPWNFIMDGEKLYLVDGYEGWEWDDKQGLEETWKKVNECLSI